MTAYALSRLCYDTLLEYGLPAKFSNEVRAVTPAFERIVEAKTLLGGLGFESGGLAAAHAIHKGLAEGETIHNEPIPMTADAGVAAIKAADAEGRRRKT